MKLSSKYINKNILMNNQTINSQVFGLIGVGIGPSNLSLAALLSTRKDLNYVFYEQKPQFTWHENNLLNNAKLQTSFLKDLSTCVDPTNPYTFLSYLVNHKRIYQWINKKTDIVSRQEFGDYLKWAASRIPNLKFSTKVEKINFNKEKSLFEILLNINQNKTIVFCKNLAIGAGITPYIPERFKYLLSSSFFHTDLNNIKLCQLQLQGKKIAIIGGGQSGAEVFNYLISCEVLPQDIMWVSKRLNFKELEDNCFANEYYTPNYIAKFYSLPASIKNDLNNALDLTSNGITKELLNEIYHKIYELKHFNKGKPLIHLRPHTRLETANKVNKAYLLNFKDLLLDKEFEYEADIVIMATGYKSNALPLLLNLFPVSKTSADILINEDYSIDWENHNNKIFILNGAKHTHGVVDLNLSLAAFRSSVIIESLLGSKIYNTYHYRDNLLY